MSKAVKISLIVAGCLITIGLLTAIAGAVLIASGIGDFNLMTEAAYKSYDITEKFDSISVNCVESDIKIVLIESGNCRVECTDKDKVTHRVEVRDNSLQINRIDDRPWYDRIFNIDFTEYRITIYLPTGNYENVTLRSVSGDIEVPEGMSCNTAYMYSISGNIFFSAKVNSKLESVSTSGDITIKKIMSQVYTQSSTSDELIAQQNMHCTDVKAITVSGDISLSDFSCNTLDISSTSGKIKMNSIDALSIKSNSISGNIELDKCNALKLSLETISGDVSGKLTRHKSYSTSTVSGKVNVPPSSGSETCDVSTVSGNITFE